MPPGVSNTELLARFREIGEESINSLLLTYFKTQVGDGHLRMASRVFPRPTNSDVVVANQLAVRKCLSDNWQGIQDAYPCLYDFEYVLGEADFLYTIRYPYAEISTYTVRIVETVDDFVDFIFDFIQNLCMPCILQSDKSCGVLRKKMVDALELCAEEECTETRRNLLNFVIENLENTDPTSSTTNMDPSIFTSAKAVVKPIDRGVGFLTTDNKAKRIGDRYEVEYAQMYPTDEKDRFVSNHYKVELPVMNNLFNLLATLQRHGDSITKPMANRYVQDVLGLKKEVIVAIDEGAGPEFKLSIENVYLADTMEKMVITGNQASAFEKDMNKVRNAMWKNGEIDLIVGLVRNYQLQEVPYDWSVRGMFDENNDFRAQYIVYVVGNNLHCQDINKMMNAHDGAKMLMDKQVDKQVTYKTPNSDNRKFVSGETYGKDGTDRSCKINGHEVLDLSNLRPKAISENAMIFTEALWGDKETFLDPDTFRKVVIFLDEHMATDDTRGTPELYEVFNLLTNQILVREAVKAVKDTGDIHHNLAIAKELTRVSNEIKNKKAGHSVDIVKEFVESFDDPLTCLVNAPGASEEIEDSINTLIHQWLATDTPRLMEDKLVHDVVGWQVYRDYRDAVKRAEENGLELTGDLGAKKKALDKAYVASKITWAKGPDIGFFAQLWRKEFRGKLDALPRIFESLSLITSYHEIEMVQPDQKEMELFKLNAHKMLYSQSVERVDEISYDEIKAFAEELSYNLHSNILSSEHNPWRTYFAKSKLFISMYIAVMAVSLLGIYLHRPKKDDNGSDINIPLHVRRVEGIKLTTHIVVVLGGLCGGHMDISMLHLLLFAMLRMPDAVGRATWGRREPGESAADADLRRQLDEAEAKTRRAEEATRKREEAARLLMAQPSTFRGGRVIPRR